MSISEQAGWLPSDDARSMARHLFENDFAFPNLDALVDGVLSFSSTDPASSGVYDATLVDLVRLLEEFRYGITVASLYAIDAQGTMAAMRGNHKEWPHNVGLSVHVMAMLSGRGNNHLPPDQLLIDPTTRMPGSRLLGGWWAGQLIDSAIVRGISVMDRIATLLFCHAGLVDPSRMPAFRHWHLRKLSAVLGGEPEWGELLDLSTNEVFEFVKNLRDGYIHRSRLPSELHGDFVTSSRDDQGNQFSARGLEPAQHLATASALFRVVICPALDLAGQIIARRSSQV